MKQKRPSFFAIYKDFNSNEMCSVDVLEYVFNSFLTEKNCIRKKDFKVYNYKNLTYDLVTTKPQFAEYVKNELMYQFWGRSEWEFIAVDWPNKDTVDDSHPVKISVYDLIKPNLDLIIDIAWNFIEPKITL